MDDFIEFARREFDQFNPSILRCKQNQLFLQEVQLLFPNRKRCQKYFQKTILYRKSAQPNPKVDVLSELSDTDINTFGSTYVAAVNMPNTCISVLKFFKQPERLDKIAHFVHELLIGLAVVNRLARRLPTFIRTEGFVSNSEIFPVQELDPNAKQRLQDLSDPNCPILVLQPVLPSVSLFDWLMSTEFQINIQCHFYAHILCSLMVAFEDAHFIHQDLLLSNILLQPFNSDLGRCLYVDSWDDVGIVYPSSLAGIQYRVLVHKYIPRLIDYGVSSARIQGQYYSYLDVIHDTPETYHFMSDVSKLIGFPIWHQFSGGCANNIHMGDLSMSMAIATHQKALQWALDNDCTFGFYVDSWLAMWMYRRVYPLETILEAAQHENPKSVLEFQYLPWNIHPIFEHVCYLLATFEVCTHMAQHWPDTQFAYIPRHLNPLELVNYLYLPNFEIFVLLEEIYIKLKQDRVMARSIPVLNHWLRFIENTGLFETLRVMFLLQPQESYRKCIQSHMFTMHRMWPHVQVYLETVLLDPKFLVNGRPGYFSKQIKKNQNHVA